MTVKTAPRLTPADAVRIARDLYGLEGSACGLPSERDQNFVLTDTAGTRFVLKLANAEEDEGVLDFQNQALRRLGTEIVTTIDGGITGRVAGHFVRLLPWIEGQCLAQVAPHTPEILASLGEKLAEIDAALAGFSHPGMHRKLHWDIRQADLARRHLPLLSPRRSELVEQYFAAWEAIDWNALRHSVIHGDANDYNVLVRDGRVVTILDLGDSVYTATVCDLAIAVAYAMLDKPDPLAVMRTIVAAYDAKYPLIAAEKAAVFPLAMTRLAMSVCISSFNAREAAGDLYQQVSAAPAWRLLERMAPVPMDVSPAAVPEADDLLRRRHASLGPNLSVSYDDPLHIVRGWRQYLYDPGWRPYLDCVNNVAHVGHCHPRVVRAIAEQSARLNTNTRYLHELTVEYAERLAATLPDPLSVVYLVCSGSEANELALRMARTHTGHRDVVVLDAAYHGNTQTLIDVSPYKYDGPGGRGKPSWVRQMPYREPLRKVEPGAAAFLHESALGCAGQVFLAPGYLQTSYAAARAAGAVCIADEVQTGFGRAGSHFWMFETQGVIPDIVTLGKPIGNGHPMGAVITTREIAASFANGMEYFNTFGGNPVSCAAGLAVLDVIRDEGLQQNARETGAYLLAGLRELATRQESVTEARGLGLFLGLELTAAEPAAATVNRMKELGVLLSTDGPPHNVIKIKPPLCFTREDADLVIHLLDSVLG